MKKVSILITNYNYARYINRCIRSCLDQNFKKDEYEIIIIDDKSNDNSCSQLNYWNNKDNIRVIFNEENEKMVLSIPHWWLKVVVRVPQLGLLYKQWGYGFQIGIVI